MSKLIALDFDGVIHSYESKWQGPTVIPDLPTPDALPFIRACLDSSVQVCIFSTRNICPGGVEAMQAWLAKHGLEKVYLDRITFPSEKPNTASLFIDDRAYLFEGSFPSIEYIKQFKPWNKRHLP